MMKHNDEFAKHRLEEHRPEKRRGAALVLVAVLMPVIVGMVAFSIDIGMMVLLRSQVQNAVDAGALAASLTLQADPLAVDDAVVAARSFIQANRVGSLVTIPQNAITVETGTWDWSTKTFTSTSVSPDAVHVFARQDNESFLFAKIFGLTTFGAPASAVASGAGSSLDIMLVLDLSGSMNSQGRIQALWAAVPTFIDVIESNGGDDYIGVMGLSANPSTYNPAAAGHTGTMYSSGLHSTSDTHVGVLESDLTSNFSQLRTVTLSSSNLQAAKYGGYTGTGAALGDAAHYLANSSFSRSSARKILVLMSDGYANKPSGAGPAYARQMAAYAAGLGITVHTISLGTSADIVLMQDIANASGGTHFDATGSGGTLSGELTKAFRDAATVITKAQLVD